MGIRDLHFIPDQKDIMAKAFRELIGVGPSTASTKDSVLVIIDAQNEYANGQLKTENVASTRKAISSILEKYRAANAPLVHIVHQTPSGAPVFTPDTDLAKEFAELEPKSGEKVIGKQQPGSFTGTDLGVPEEYREEQVGVDGVYGACLCEYYGETGCRERL